MRAGQAATDALGFGSVPIALTARTGAQGPEWVSMPDAPGLKLLLYVPVRDSDDLYPRST